MPDVLVPVMRSGEHWTKSSLSALSEARVRAIEMGGQAHAVVVGEPPPQQQLAHLGVCGAEKVFAASGEQGLSGSWLTAIDAVLDLCDLSYVLLGGGVISLEVAGRLVARRGGGIATDVTSLVVSGGELAAKRPVLSDSQVGVVRFIKGLGVIVGRSGAFELRTEWTPGVELIELQGDCSSSDRGRKQEHGRVTLKAAARDEASKQTLVGADVIVTGGRGLEGPENFVLIERLAAALGEGSVVGATRAVVDAGWRSIDAQVGSTGQKVSPKLYVAVGVSGAVQHRAGMETSPNILAINNDQAAPIFEFADLGVVADLHELLPALIDALSARTAGVGD